MGYRWEEYSFSLNVCDKISELKKKIQEKMGVSSVKQNLFVHTIIQVEEGGESYKREVNIQLDPKKTLRNYNLEENTTVYCVDEELFMENNVEECKEKEMEPTSPKSFEETRERREIESMNRAEQASAVSMITLARLEETKGRIVSEERELEKRIGETQKEVKMIEGKVEKTKKEGETAIKELEIVLNKLRALRKENEKE